MVLPKQALEIVDNLEHGNLLLGCRAGGKFQAAVLLALSILRAATVEMNTVRTKQGASL